MPPVACLCPALAYPLNALDPLADDPSRDDGEPLRKRVQALLSECVNTAELVEALMMGVHVDDSEDVRTSLKAALSPTIEQSRTKYIVQVLWRLVAPRVTLMTPSRADVTLNNLERSGIVPVLHDERCAVLRDTPAATAATMVLPQRKVLMTVRVAAAVAHVELTPVDTAAEGLSAVAIANVCALDGVTRRRVWLVAPSRDEARAAFDTQVLEDTPAWQSRVRIARMLLPRTPSHLPAFIMDKIADFWQSRLRIHVLTAAANAARANASTSARVRPQNFKSNRFVAFEEVRAFFCGQEEPMTRRFAVRAILHASSASCVCFAHNKKRDKELRPIEQFCKSQVELTLYMCGGAVCNLRGCALHRHAAHVVPSLCAHTCCSDVVAKIDCVHTTTSGERRNNMSIGPIRLDSADTLHARTLMVAALRCHVAVQKAFQNTDAYHKNPHVDDDSDDEEGMTEKERKLVAMCLNTEAWLAPRLEDAVRARCANVGVPSDTDMLRLDARATELLQDHSTVKMRRGEGVALFRKREGDPSNERKVLLKPDSDLHDTTHLHLFRWEKRARR